MTAGAAVKMSRLRLVTAEACVDDAGLADVLRPRDGLVLERDAGPGAFTAAAGPLADYRRAVDVEAAGDGLHRIRQTVEYRLDLPFWGWLFRLPLRHQLRRLDDRPGVPWWAPPDRLDPASAGALAALCALSVVVGYLGTVLTQTITFAADEFGAGKGAQGVALAAVRADVVVALVLVAMADKRGRRRVLLLSSGVGCALTATGALAPSLWFLAGSQVATRGFVTAAAIVLTVAVAEEMPKGSRAYAVSLLAMAGAVGAGLCVLLLRVADAAGGWRVLFALSLVGLPVVGAVGRRLPESRRFVAPHGQAGLAGHGRRFWLLAVSAFLFNLFFAPASQFGNEYLRTERGFSAGRISLFTILTATPGAIGVVVGGRMAERGRRKVGAVALTVGVGATVVMFVSSGWPLWAWSVAASVVGGATIPALGVYGPELFPTATRGLANGTIAVLGRAGSVVGLIVAGQLADSFDRLGPAMALLALGPLALAILVMTSYPETAHTELEDLNPEDAPMPLTDGAPPPYPRR
ncbi:MAG TPA: MFS transporter [Acidimicrobiales bacterium]|nr:MFS transporter [Acidimicrobiales bacterium]